MLRYVHVHPITIESRKPPPKKTRSFPHSGYFYPFPRPQKNNLLKDKLRQPKEWMDGYRT